MYSLTHFPWACDSGAMAVSPRSAARAEPNSERFQDLTIDPSGALRAGRAMMTFVPGDERSFLVAYLKLVRWLRHQKSTPEIVLRRTEIELLADHLGADPGDILERLATLMGATTTQRRALVATFATGAAVIFLAVGASAASGGGGGTPPPASTTPTRDAGPAATIVDESIELHDALPVLVITSAPSNDDVAAVAAFAAVDDVVSATNPAQPASTPPAEPTAAPAAATAPDAIPPTAAVDATAATSTTASAPAEVAVGEPPVPTPPFEVAVGEPPVPTPPFEVAVGEPPVPTPPGG